MRRLTGWEGLLDAELEKARTLVFAWGENDCVTWAANIVLALTGEDLIAPQRGSYPDEESARRVIFDEGGLDTDFAANLEACVDARLPRIEVPFARRGDLVRWGNALGVCAGADSFFLTPKNGVRPIRTLRCQSAWRVG